MGEGAGSGEGLEMGVRLSGGNQEEGKESNKGTQRGLDYKPWKGAQQSARNTDSMPPQKIPCSMLSSN